MVLHSNFSAQGSQMGLSKGYIDSYSPRRKKMFLILATVMLIVDLIMDAVNPLFTPSQYEQKSRNLDYILLPSLFFLYLFSYSTFVTQVKIFQKMRLVFILRSISVLILSVHVYIICFYQIKHALTSGLEDSWINACSALSRVVYILLVIIIISPSLYLKPIVVLCFYLGMLTAYISVGYYKLWWIIMRDIASLIFALALVAFQSISKWTLSRKTMGLEEWNNVYKEILDENPSFIAVISDDGNLIYSNRGFRDATHNDINTFLKAVTGLKLRDPFGACLNGSELNIDSPPNALSPSNSEKRFIRPKSYVQKKMSIKGTRSTMMTFPHLGAVVDHYRELLTAEYLSKDDQIIFDGKLDVCAGTSGVFRMNRDTRSGSINKIKHTLSFEIIIRPLVKYKNLILILNDTTERDLVVSLENNSEYKDKVLASVSHELRTPLNWNLGFLQTALNSDKITNEMKNKLIAPAFRSGKILKYVIDDILDYSHIQSEGIRLNMKEKPLIETLNYCIELVRDAFKAKNLSLNVKVGPGFPELFRTDHERLTQLLLNLLTNALKFTMTGGVMIGATWLGDSKAEIKVQDTGIGIRQQSIPRLLEEKFSNKKTVNSRDVQSKGVGLGLKIAHKLGQILEGNDEGGIQIYSDYGKGSSFYFVLKHRTDEMSSVELSEIMEEIKEEDNDLRLPHNSFTSAVGSILSHREVPHEHLNEDEIVYHKPLKDYFKIKKAHKIASPKSPQPERIISARSREMPKVLIVDDDPFNILVLEALLNQSGILKDSANNGEEAIQKVLKKPDGYGLIFMDCQMPVMDGFEATTLLIQKMKKGEIPKIPIIGCTAFSGQEKLKKCLSHGMNEVMFKPVMKDRVFEIIKKYMEMKK